MEAVMVVVVFGEITKSGGGGDGGGIRLIIKTSPLLARQHKIVRIEAFFLAVVVIV